MNITLNIDEDIVKKVRKIAIDKDATLTAIVSEYLTWLSEGDAQERQQRIELLGDSIRRMSREMGQRKWNREDIYVR